MPNLARSHASLLCSQSMIFIACYHRTSAICCSTVGIGTLASLFGYEILQRVDRLAVVAREHGGDGLRWRSAVFYGLQAHIFEKLRACLRLFHFSENFYDLLIRNRAADSIVIIANHNNVENIAGDISAQIGISAAYRLHIVLAAGSIKRSRHERILEVTSGQVL